MTEPGGAATAADMRMGWTGAVQSTSGEQRSERL